MKVARPDLGARLRRLWDQASLYLPVLLMGALALGSYAIVQRTPMPAAPTPQPPLTQGQPDTRLQHFEWHRYRADGTRELTLRGRQLDHFPASRDTRVLDAYLLRRDASSGVQTEAWARTLHTDDDRRTYRLDGAVRVVRQTSAPGSSASRGAHEKATPRLTFEGETLTWLTQERLLRSDQPVRITRGADTLLGNQLRYDEARGTLDLQGQVRATLVARRTADQ
ncbi:LPS export ABC transporter periplasmic protein LptC [Tepidimonas charontis]|uniref:Lipopolysaccharide export system protein LptC n=1 Tax=Tepidimonas charontis TaxID=2267262 RepID=A0A554XDJ3_9BURK|nr:LPS export ABC transporter periplasmic protein LptC [Tepidimonas charontis]TSE33905.1 Lipopolysaccharide export system protein LptC [Tepidimonas charontis]